MATEYYEDGDVNYASAASDASAYVFCKLSLFVRFTANMSANNRVQAKTVSKMGP